jgi:cyanate lyase
MPNREEVTNKIQDEKRSRGLSWKKPTEGNWPWFLIPYTAALLGQMTLTKSEAENAAKVLGLSEAEAAILTESPIEREPNAKGDRVKIGMSGKFLPYKRY